MVNVLRPFLDSSGTLFITFVDKKKNKEYQKLHLINILKGDLKHQISCTCMLAYVCIEVLCPQSHLMHLWGRNSVEHNYPKCTASFCCKKEHLSISGLPLCIWQKQSTSFITTTSNVSFSKWYVHLRYEVGCVKPPWLDTSNIRLYQWQLNFSFSGYSLLHLCTEISD